MVMALRIVLAVKLGGVWILYRSDQVIFDLNYISLHIKIQN